MAPISTKTHAVADYATGALLLLRPQVTPARDARARALLRGTGAAALGQALFTDWDLAVDRRIPPAARPRRRPSSRSASTAPCPTPRSWASPAVTRWSSSSPARRPPRPPRRPPSAAPPPPRRATNPPWNPSSKPGGGP